MPDAMREYIESQATKGHYSASEYVRHLIRQDQLQHAQTERNLLWDYLLISARQLDEGDTVDVNIEDILKKGRERRKKSSR